MVVSLPIVHTLCIFIRIIQVNLRAVPFVLGFFHSFPYCFQILYTLYANSLCPVIALAFRKFGGRRYGIGVDTVAASLMLSPYIIPMDGLNVAVYQVRYLTQLPAGETLVT